MKKRGKQILAMAGVIILIGIYIALFFTSIFDDPDHMSMFLGCVCTVIAVPIMIWGYLTVIRLLGKNKEKSEERIEK